MSNASGVDADVGEPTEADTDSETIAAPETAPDQLPLDVIFDILKNRRRRLVLRYTRENEGPFTLSDLAEYIAAYENDKPVEQLSSDERKRVYVGLYQCHLPRMDDTGILDFDRNRGTVTMNGSVSQLESYLHTDSEEDGRRWPVYYGGLALVGFLLYGAALVPAVPITLPLAALLVLVALGGSSVLHLTLEQ